MENEKSLAEVAPVEVRIPTPCYTPRRRGRVNSKRYGDQIRVRISEEELQLLDKICDDLGMARATFIRWCCVHTADQLDRWKEQRYGNPDRPRGFRRNV